MERRRSAENFLKFYFDTELLTEGESKLLVVEISGNIEKIEKKREDFLKKIEAKDKLAEGSRRKEVFEKIRADEFGEREKEADLDYMIAARNGIDGMGEEEMGRDKLLFEKIKKELGKN